MQIKHVTFQENNNKEIGTFVTVARGFVCQHVMIREEVGA